MQRKSRPAHTRPGCITNGRELGERLRVSRERLAGSELANVGQAWRLWSACIDATVGYARGADLIYVSTLASASGVHRSKAAPLLRQFDELGVFVWSAAPRGSHGISELALPHVPPRLHDGVHVPPAVHVDASTCTSHGSLQSNTSESYNVKNSEGERLQALQRTSHDAETGASRSGTPEEERARPLEEFTREDLDRAAYRAVIDGDDARLGAIRDEVHRRDVSGNAAAYFGEGDA